MMPVASVMAPANTYSVQVRLASVISVMEREKNEA